MRSDIYKLEKAKVTATYLSNHVPCDKVQNSLGNVYSIIVYLLNIIILIYDLINEIGETRADK